MHLLHHSQPDRRGIAAIQTVERVVMLIADPNRSRILGRNATEPDIGIRGRRTGLTCCLHAGNLRAGRGTIGGNILQAFEHVVRGAHILKAQIRARIVFQNHIALRVEHLGIGARAAEHTFVDEGGEAARHFAHGHAVGQRAQCQRRIVDIALDRAVLIGAAANQLNPQPLGHEIIGCLRREHIHHLHGNGVDRAGDTAFDRH